MLGCASNRVNPRVCFSPAYRYNPDNMETLEQYAQFQAESHHYDFEANLTLMKL